jgi:hypothetical protein
VSARVVGVNLGRLFGIALRDMAVDLSEEYVLYATACSTIIFASFSRPDQSEHNNVKSPLCSPYSQKQPNWWQNLNC